MNSKCDWHQVEEICMFRKNVLLYVGSEKARISEKSETALA